MHSSLGFFRIRLQDYAGLLAGVLGSDLSLRCLRCLSLETSRAIFSLFWGCRQLSFANAISDHLDTIHGLSRRPLTVSDSIGDSALWRADLGQSQSGNSSLSPRAYRAQNRDRRIGHIGDFTDHLCPCPSILLWALLEGRKGNSRKVAGQIGGLGRAAIPSGKLLLIDKACRNHCSRGTVLLSSSPAQLRMPLSRPQRRS